MKKPVLISPAAIDLIHQEVARLQPPGGLVQVYDSEARSVIVVCIDKRGPVPVATGWTVHGPCSPEEAAALLRGNTEATEVDGWPGNLH